MAPYFRAARVLAVPIRSGSGLRVKILESLARGLPVVATTVGVEGIAARSEEHLIVADDPRIFADGLVRALQDDALVKRLSEDGRRLALHRYDRSVIGRQLLSTLEPLSAVHARVATKVDGPADFSTPESGHQREPPPSDASTLPGRDP